MLLHRASHWIVRLVSSLCVAICGLSGEFHAQNNVLIFLADDLGVEGIGAYQGSAPPPTPNIDSLAASGVLFRNAWANPLCSPTRACIMTGRYSFRTGIGESIQRNSVAVLRYSELTIPEVLDFRRSGYDHAAIGKWHLGNGRNGGLLCPNRAGWRHYEGSLLGLNPNYFQWKKVTNGALIESNTYNTTDLVDAAIAWVSTAQEPWVCYVPFAAPHVPLHAPPANLHSYNLAGLSPLTTPVPFYEAMIEAMDTEIGRMLAALGPTLANTDVIFMGDNGAPPQVAGQAPPFNTHGSDPCRVKGSAYEGGLRVPLIISGPSVTAPGREELALVGAVDLFSTVLEICNATPSAEVTIDSVSMVPYLSNADQTPLRGTVFSEYFGQNSDPCAPGISIVEFDAIRDPTFKLIRFTETQTEEFYDLISDPLEANDLLLGVLTAQQQQAYTSLSTELDALKN